MVLYLSILVLLEHWKCEILQGPVCVCFDAESSISFPFDEIDQFGVIRFKLLEFCMF